MNFEISGTLLEKYDEMQISDKFKKREFVLETADGSYTEQIKFQLVQDKTGLIEPFNVGDKLNVKFNIKGNKWKDNYFVNLQAWKIDNEQNAAPTPSAAPSVDEAPMPTGNDLPPAGDIDDLPF